MKRVQADPDIKIKQRVGTKLRHWSRGCRREEIRRKISEGRKRYFSRAENRVAIGQKLRELYKQQYYKELFRHNAITTLSKLQKLKPTRLEVEIMEILRELAPEFKYVGDGKCIIAGKCPDFIDYANKRVILVNGCYWHGCPIHYPSRIEAYKETLAEVKHYRRYGYQVICIWEHDLLSKKMAG
jgi:G:T-mismatch repair DNA endonuclease (very short patch repair protein)